MEHAEHSGFSIPFAPFGFDLAISQAVVIMWGTALTIFLFLVLANRFKTVRLVEEFLYEFVADAFGSSLKTKNPIWFSFLITLFLFVFFNNLSGLIPGGESPTSNINVTGALAIMVFLIAQGSGMAKHGFHHFQNLIPGGIPKLMLPFFVPLEIVSQLARPFSLAVRLFANMFSGHKVLTIFITLSILGRPYITALPFAGVVLISMFEIFVSFIQAFIFTYLASFYISDAVNASH